MASTATKSLRDRYDCVVAGAGPAGLNAARWILDTRPSATILLTDKSNPWEHPKPCAEAVGRLGFEEALGAAVDRRWIRHVISTAAFHAPCGAQVAFTDADKGFIIDRGRMQKDLAQRAADRGVHLLTETAVQSVEAREGGRRVVVLADGRSVSAGVVIDASGASSPLGRGEGITWKAYDSEPAYFVIADSVEHTLDAVHIYMGREVAPGGYAWMFPGEGQQVNIGVLVGTDYRGAVNIRELLERFIAAQFPSARVLSRHAGTIACGYRRNPIAVPGLVKAGDAASTTNPMSRAGIVEALKSGLLAGRTAMAMLDARDDRALARLCRDYEKAWFATLGKRHQKLLDTKGAMQSVPDKDYDAAAKALSEVPRGKMTMARIFRASLSRFPRLVWAMRHLM